MPRAHVLYSVVLHTHVTLNPGTLAQGLTLDDQQ